MVFSAQSVVLNAETPPHLKYTWQYILDKKSTSMWFSFSSSLTDNVSNKMVCYVMRVS